jgi:hypothetical protein
MPIGFIKNHYMKIISTKTHGVLDYLVGIILIASPWLLNFADGGAKMWIPIILGAGALAYSLMTNYELGVIKTLSMKTHLTLDLLSGIFLAASPWIFGFADTVYLPHLIFGLLEIGVSLITKTQPEGNYNRSESARSHAV